jgi:hypothetical protein
MRGTFIAALILMMAFVPSNADNNFMFGLVAYHIPFESYTLYAEDLGRIAENGIEWLSVDFAWGLIEPSNGQWDFSYYDFVVQEAEKNGLSIVAKVGNGYNGNRPVVPEWTKELSDDRYYSEIAEYAREVVERYAGRISIYAIENEANIYWIHKTSGWREGKWNREKVFNIWENLSKAVRETDAEADIVLSLSPSLNWKDWLDEALGRVYFDVIGIQPYPCLLNSDPELASNTADTIREAKSYGKEVIVLETGYHTGGRSEEDQAIYIEKMCDACINAGALGVFFYEYLDGPEEREGQEQHFGLVGNDGTLESRVPKPAWYAYGQYIASHQ